MPARSAIVLAVDFSVHSQRALEAAGALAQDLGSRVVLVHAFPPRPMPIGSPVEVAPWPGDVGVVAATELEEALALTGAWAQQLRDRGIEVLTVAQEGRPAELVLATARAEQARLIVVGTHGRAGLRRFGLGSVAQELVRKSKVPVLVVPKPEDA